MKFRIKGLDLKPTLDSLYEKYLETEKEFCSVRDNCEQCAFDLSQLFNANGFESKVVRGQFKIDRPVDMPLDIKDLYPNERKKFLEQYKGRVTKKTLSAKIFEFAQQEGIDEELYYVPHLWVEVDGIIFDPSVYQFLSSIDGEITEDNYQLLER